MPRGPARSWGERACRRGDCACGADAARGACLLAACRAASVADGSRLSSSVCTVPCIKLPLSNLPQRLRWLLCGGFLHGGASQLAQARDRCLQGKLPPTLTVTSGLTCCPGISCMAGCTQSCAAADCPAQILPSQMPPFQAAHCSGTPEAVDRDATISLFQVPHQACRLRCLPAVSTLLAASTVKADAARATPPCAPLAHPRRRRQQETGQPH